MKMVLQFQSVKWSNKYNKYKGNATYLTELLFEQTDYKTAAFEVNNTLADNAKISNLTMNVDGNSGKWGCSVDFSADAPLPLAFGIDDSPKAIFDYYIEYVESYCGKLNSETDENGNYKYNEITEVLDIKELDDGLELTVVYNKTDKVKIVIPYPPR